MYESVKCKPFNQLEFAAKYPICAQSKIGIYVKVVSQLLSSLLKRIVCDQTSSFTLFDFIGFFLSPRRFVVRMGGNAISEENTTDNCVRLLRFITVSWQYSHRIIYIDIQINFSLSLSLPLTFQNMEMGQMIAHQSFPFTLSISYAWCNE